jgi:hypothetical protein
METLNLRRGFFRITLVASIAMGTVVVLGTSKPSLDDFRWRPATELEKTQAAEWENAHGHGKELEEDLKANRHVDEHLRMYLIVIDGRVLKSPYRLIPAEFALQYYVLPFSLGVLGTWVVYAVIRFVLIAYVLKGFR